MLKGRNRARSWMETCDPLMAATLKFFPGGAVMSTYVFTPCQCTAACAR
jgi:hypothetical protein